MNTAVLYFQENPPIIRALDRKQKFDKTYPRGANRGGDKERGFQKGRTLRGGRSPPLMGLLFCQQRHSRCPRKKSATNRSRVKRITPESVFPLFCPEPYFISISALVGQKVETPFLIPLRGQTFMNMIWHCRELYKRRFLLWMTEK